MVWNPLRKRSQPTQNRPVSNGAVATRYSITHEIGKPQRLTLWGADQSMTIDLPDDTAQNLSASLTSGVIDNRRSRRSR